MSNVAAAATCVSVTLCAIGAVLILIIAVPLNTAGYNARVARNAALTHGTCIVKRYETLSGTLYYQCPPCQRRCSTTYINGMVSRSCRRVCARCPYKCYFGRWVVTVSNDAAGIVEYYLLPFGNPDDWDDHCSKSEAWPEGKQLTERSIGSEFACFIDPHAVNKKYQVRLDRYDTQPYLTAAIVFYALGGTLWVIASTVVVVFLMKQAVGRRSDAQQSGSTTGTK